MASNNRRRNGKGNGSGRPAGVIGTLAGAFLSIVLVVGLVRYGAFTKASITGFKPLTDISQLMPGDNDKRKIDNRLNLKKGAGSTAGSATGSTGTGTGTDAGTGTTGGTTGTGTDNTGTGTTPAAGNALPKGAASPIDSTQALAIARTLRTATPHTDGYDRAKQFGDWAASPGMCGEATTRDRILKRDLTAPVSDPKTCRVLSGTFHDPYTGRDMKFKRGMNTSGLIQIDHVVAVNEAYADGLWKADRKTRVAYYNDPDVLLASEGDANERKAEGANLKTAGVPAKYDRTWKNTGEKRWAASTPSIWLPSNTAYRCQYMSKRMYVKQKYGLTMSSWEKRETISYLTQCAAKGE